MLSVSGLSAQSVTYSWYSLIILNSLPNYKFLDQTKFKEFAENKSNLAKIMLSLLYRIENIVGKAENVFKWLPSQSC